MWELASAPANLWVWTVQESALPLFSECVLGLVQGHWNLDLDPISVFLVKSKGREATYCCSDWHWFCIWQDSFVNLCNKVILTNDWNHHSHTSRMEQREALCIFATELKKNTDLIDKTEANVWKLNVFISVCVKASEGLHCFIGPWGVVWDSKKHLSAWEDTSWVTSYYAVVGGQLVAQGENQAVLTGHWKQYHVLGGTSLGLLLCWSSWAALWEQDAGKLGWLSEELSPAVLGLARSHRTATCVQGRGVAVGVVHGLGLEPCVPPHLQGLSQCPSHHPSWESPLCVSHLLPLNLLAVSAEGCP